MHTAELKKAFNRAVESGDAQALFDLADAYEPSGTYEAITFAENARGIACAMRGDPDTARGHFTTLVSLGEERDDRNLVTTAYSNLCALECGVANFGEAIRIGNLVLENMAANGREADSHPIHVNLANAYSSCGEYEQALHHLHMALDIPDASSPLYALGIVHNNIASILTHVGRFDEAHEHLSKGLEAFTSCESLYGQALVISNIGRIELDRGDLALAYQHLRHAIELFEQTDDAEGLCAALTRMGNLHQSLGEYHLALPIYDRVLDMARHTGDRHLEAVVMGNIANVHYALGELGKAIDHHEKSLVILNDIGDRSGMARTYGNMGLALIDSGDLDAAETYLIRSLELHTQLGETTLQASASGSLIGLALTQERYDDARVLLDEQESIRQCSADVNITNRINHGRLAEARADLDAALAFYTEALQLASSAGMKDLEVTAHQHLRDLAQRRVDFAGYVQHNTQWLRLNDEIRGQEATRQVAMHEAQREIDAQRTEVERHRALLFTTLPPSIAERVLRGETVNDSFDAAAVLFMDIVGFTTMTAEMHPDDVVSMLSELFTRCDEIVARHGLMKIKTIGDSYMAVAFDGETERRKDGETERRKAIAMRAAWAAIDLMNALGGAAPHEVLLRMGLHIGPVTAGVIGTERLQYDVWGDTVNVASRMESHGEPGRIHVSEAFAEALQGEKAKWRKGETAEGRTGEQEFEVILRGTINIKGKGAMNTYWLEGR